MHLFIHLLLVLHLFLNLLFVKVKKLLTELYAVLAVLLFCSDALCFVTEELYNKRTLQEKREHT